MSYSYAVVSVDRPEQVSVERVTTDPERPLVVHVKADGKTLALLHMDDKTAGALIDELVEQVRDYAPF